MYNTKNVVEKGIKGMLNSNRSDYDRVVSYKIIKGRMTRARYNALNRFERVNRISIPVYSDYDCTGQLCGVYTDIYYRKTFVVIKITYSYDY